MGIHLLSIVEDVDQQAPAVLHDADIAPESRVCQGVHPCLHHQLAEGEVHHVPRLGLQCRL